MQYSVVGTDKYNLMGGYNKHTMTNSINFVNRTCNVCYKDWQWGQTAQRNLQGSFRLV